MAPTSAPNLKRFRLPLKNQGQRTLTRTLLSLASALNLATRLTQELFLTGAYSSRI